MKVTMIGRCGAFPMPGQATSGFLLETDEGSLLVDCGSGVVERVQRFVPLERLDAVIISHYHHDHVADLGVLQYAAQVTTQRGLRSAPLSMYLPQEPAQKYQTWSFEPWCTVHPIAPDTQLTLFGMQIRFLRTKHPVPCLGMVFERQGKKVCYTADTSMIPELVPFAENADVLICETSFYKHQDPTTSGHLTSAEAGQLARAACVKRMVMTHLPSFGSLEELQAEVVEQYDGPVALSETGLRIEL